MAYHDRCSRLAHIVRPDDARQSCRSCPETTTDVWDVSQGGTVLNHSEILTPWFDARDMFGGTFGAYLPEQSFTIFTDAYPKGYIHWVEWRTPSPFLWRASTCVQVPMALGVAITGA